MLEKLKILAAAFGVGLLSLLSSAITIDAGKVALEAADKTKIDTVMTGAASSLFGLSLEVLPYVAVFAVISFVLFLLMGLAKFRR